MVEHEHPTADPATRSGRVLFFIMLAVIVGSIAVFLILKPA
jgi:hypothetical protein